MAGGGKPGNSNATQHGHSGQGRRTPTYQSWRCMKERCYRERHKWFDAYGGRGIIVCDAWLGRDGFARFLRDLGPRPDGATVHRRDRDGAYEPGNCEWASKSTQNAELPRGSDGRYGAQENTC